MIACNFDVQTHPITILGACPLPFPAIIALMRDDRVAVCLMTSFTSHREAVQEYPTVGRFTREQYYALIYP